MHACVCVKVRGCVIYNEIRYECIPTKILKCVADWASLSHQGKKEKNRNKRNKQTKQAKGETKEDRKKNAKMEEWKKETEGGRKKG